MERLLQDLDQAGVNLTRTQRNKLYAPIGLDIGAESCEGIALAIVAEIRAMLAGRVGGRLRDRQTKFTNADQQRSYSELLDTKTRPR